MATSTATQTAVQPALLFMPDISGFTNFVTNTEITHAQFIIQELLEVLVESNQINLQVSEFEGDAIFFYRIGGKPKLEQLLEQIETMFTRFHQHLQLYDHSRICPCGACSSAINLKLKIFVHYGEVSGYMVKDHQVLFGKDVIVIHRLMKNSLNKSEYALFTDAAVEAYSGNVPEWFQPEEAVENYDVGEIRLKIADLSHLRNNIPPVPLPSAKFSDNAKTVLTEEKIIPAPMLDVYLMIFDLENRKKWFAGVKDMVIIGRDKINRTGTSHRCIISEKNNPIIVTERASIDSNKVELVEMDNKGMGGCRYTVEKINENESKFKIDVIVKNNPLIQAMFKLFMKRTFKKTTVQSIENLYSLCKQNLN